ncbi:MAG: glycosyltransferase family 2 protein [Verrucomicrobiia bacterium]|jgi:glycosyltransferase involved in cell wall biosynthesis
MTSPLVSVVIPTYNYGHYICETVESALAQTYSPVEIIVVDDGSTDDTRERLATYGNRVRYIRQQNRGLSAARNTGIQAAQGAFIALLDSDDLWLPDKLERQVAVAVHQPDAGLVASEAFTICEDGQRLDFEKERCPREGFRELTVRDLLEFGAFSPSSVLTRRDALLDGGGFDEGLKAAEDLEMWIRIAVRSRVLRLNASLTGQREHSGSMSHQADRMFQNHRRAIDQLFVSVPQLRGRLKWRRIAEARMHREVAFMRFSGGDRTGALRDLLRSGCRWPFALRDRQAKKKHLERAKMFLRYGLVRKPVAEGGS